MRVRVVAWDGGCEGDKEGGGEGEGSERVRVTAGERGCDGRGC